MPPATTSSGSIDAQSVQSAAWFAGNPAASLPTWREAWANASACASQNAASAISRIAPRRRRKMGTLLILGTRW